MGDQRQRAIIWIVGVAAVVVAFLIAILLIPVSSGRLEAMRSRVTKLKDEARSRNVSRPVLRGEATPGNAWDEYNIALNEARELKEDRIATNLTQFNARTETADRAMAERLLAAHPGVIDHLRRGAQRSDGQYPYQWERGSQAAIPSLLGSLRMTQLAVAQSRIWEESGRPKDAADLLLDASQFAGDLATNGTLLPGLAGLNAYSLTLDGLKSLVLSGKLSRQQLAALAGKLEIADRNFPALGPALMNEAALSGIAIDVPDGQPSIRDWLFLAKEGGWRYGLSPQQIALDAFEQRDSYAQRSLNIDKMPFDDATKEAKAITAETEANGNPLVRMSVPSVPKALAVHREALARLRLLRAATTFLATGEIPELADPFGKTLSHAQEAGKLRIWSNGRDGENQNGLGNWNQVAGQDIVLEIVK
jgi:hypothetical protein